MWQLTEEQKRTLAFMKEMADEAMAEARKGDTAQVNALAKKSNAFGQYFTQVMAGTVTPEQFGIQYPSLLKEAEMVRKEYERSLKADVNEERLNKIEEGLQTFKTELLAEVKALLETLKPVEAEKPTKKGKTFKTQLPEGVTTSTTGEVDVDPELIETESEEGDNAESEA